MNRKNVIEWGFFILLFGTMLAGMVIVTEQKNQLEETLIEKENVISDMEAHIEEQLQVIKTMKGELETLQLQHAEVLETLATTQADLEDLRQENQALHSQNDKLAKQVSALETKAKQVTVSRNNTSSVTKEFYVTATAYTAYCSGCSGKTKTGIDLRANPHLKVIAVDPNVIPLGTKVWVEGYGNAVAGDTGGAIKGNKIDVFMPQRSDALQWGRKKVRVKVLGN